MHARDRRGERKAQAPSRAASASLRAGRTGREPASGRPAQCPGPRSAIVRTTDPPIRSAVMTTSGFASASADPRSGAPYLSALSTRLAIAWPISSRLPLTVSAPSDADGQRDAFFLGDRLVKFGDASRRFADVEQLRRADVAARLGARDQQQRVEDLDERVRFLDRLLEREAIGRRRRRRRRAPPRRGCAGG